jgi:hypothetical protein
MLGSVIITNALFNIYGDTPAPTTAATRAIKELYDILLKAQRARKWWFNRAKATYPVLANINEIDLSALGVSLGEIFGVEASATGVTEYALISVKNDDGITGFTGNPVRYMETFVDYTDMKLHVYPTPEIAFSYELDYRKLYVPATYADMATYDSDILDILNQYLEAALTVRMSVLLDYPDKVATFAQVSAEELDNLVKQNADYNAQGVKLSYGGI